MSFLFRRMLPSSILLSCCLFCASLAAVDVDDQARLARLDERLHEGKAQAVVQEIRKLLADNAVEPRNVWRLRQRLAVAFLDLGQPQAAVIELETALGEAPEDPALHLNLGRALWLLDRRGRAVAEYECAVELAPDRYLWRLEFAEALLGLGIHRDALDQIRLARAICGDCPQALRAEANVHLDRGDQAGSIEPLYLLFSQEPRRDVRYLLAAALWAADEPQAVAALLDTIAVLQLTSPEWMLLIQSDRRLGRAERALAWARQERALMDDDGDPKPQFWAIASEICLAAGYPDEALIAIDRALSGSPRTAVYHHNRAVILMQLGQKAAADEALAEARRFMPDTGLTH